MRVILRRSIVLAVAALTLSGFIAFLAGAQAGADTITCSSSSVGTTGDTPTFGRGTLAHVVVIQLRQFRRLGEPFR